MKEELENNETINLPNIIEALLSSLDDKNQDVRQSVIDSIVRISEKNSDVVIQTTVCFWEQHKKMSTEHKVSLLKMMSNMCKYISTSLNADLASSVADLAVNELTGETETGAAELLVALSKTHCTQAMGGLLSRLEPGVLPHHALVFTIGKLATANPSGMLSFVKLILTIILPMLNQIREENLKQAICFTTGKLCEAINDCITNAAEINSHTYQEEIYSVFDILTYNWLKMSRDLKTTEAVLTALVPMMPLLPQEVVNENIVKLLPVCLNLCKKQTIRLAAVKVLAIALNSATTIDDKEILHPYMEQIHQTLSGFVSIFPFEATRDVLLTHYEVLQCSRSLVILYPEEGLERILQQVRSSNASQRARALIVLKHLINTLPPEDDGSLNRIALTLQESLAETSALQMVGAIVALAARPTFSLSSSQRITFIRYMVSHCGVKNNDTEAYSDALHLLATTVNGAELWLWPCLIDVLLDSTCVASAASVLRALSPLAAKIISSEISSMPERDFPGTKVLARCLELLGNSANRFAATIFLRVAAPLVGHRLKPYWDKKLSELAQFLQDEQKSILKNSAQRDLIWEEKLVEWLEESVKLEGNSWGTKLADELALKSNAPGVAPLFALLCNNHAHIILLVEHARSHGGNNKEYARAVGICAKRHLSIVLKVMDEFCTAEDTRKVPVRILGFMKDFVKDFAKAADATETAKAGLLQSYAEIAQRADPENFFPVFEEHVLPWTVKHLTASKELSTKEAGLSVLEQLSKAVHPTRWAESKGLHMKGTTLALLMGMLQSSTGYRPLQLYPAILKAAISIIRIPPTLSHEENEIFLTGILDKTIGATTEIVLLLQPDILQQVTDELGILSNEIISDSADMLATLIDILLPWMQTKSSIERKITLLVLDTVLRSYYNSIKYTYPSGKFDAGKLVGRTLSWFAIAEFSLRPLVVDCVFLSLNIACRHRSIMPDTKLDEELKRIKTNITTLDKSIINEVMESLAKAVSERIPSSEIIGLAEGLIEGLLFGGEAGLVVGIALSQHFKIKGSEMSRNDVGLVDNIVTQMRHMENANCRITAAAAIVLLMAHHPEEVIERMLLQPLPLDRATELCWKEIGNNDLGHRALELLLIKLEANNLFSETTTSTHLDRNNTASFQSLTAVIALKHLLQTPNAENLIEKQLPKLLSILLKYLAGWLQVDAPAAVMSTKYGYVPNLEARKIKPHAEVYSVLSNVLIMVNPNAASTLLKEIVSSSTTKIEENVVLTVRKLIECVLTRNDVLSNMAQSIGKLMTSTIAIQRAVAATFYAELIGKVDCGVIWLDAIINTLYEAKADSSSLVRTLATTGLSRIAYVDQKLIDVYFDNCMDALLDGLEEPASGEGGSEVVLESLRGLAVLLSVQSKTPISPRVVMALKPFIEKENVDMKFAAISVLGAIAINWQTTAALADDNDLSDHLLWCLPCLIVRLEDANILVAKITQETLYKIANILQCEKLSRAIRINLGPQAKFNFEAFMRDLINCLKEELPQRAEELRNAVVRGYSRSENHHTRATSALLLGLFGSPRSEDIQRLLQLLNDKENIVKIRASQALSCCFSF